MVFRVGILTVSDTAAKDAAADKSGPLLASTFAGAGDGKQYHIAAQRIVPDDVEAIQECVRQWIDGQGAADQHSSAGTAQTHVDLVVCTGGTGFGIRDVTPEALKPLLDRETMGLTQALVQYSLAKTPMAALSRLVTGIRRRRSNSSTLSQPSTGSIKSPEGECLIIALPGSTKAVKECCEVLLGTASLLPHALELLAGDSGREQHLKMHQGHASAVLSGTETDTGKSRGSAVKGCGHDGGHHHHHGHGHGHHAPKPRTAQPDGQDGFKTHDPSQSVSLRHRSSPYPIISMDEALRLILQKTQSCPVTSEAVTSRIRGSVLAEDVCAPRSLPPRPTTNVDGYAVLASSTPPGPYPVVTHVTTLPAGSISRINTGQALPEGADAVLMVEDTELLQQTVDGEEKTVEVKAQIDAGENVRKPGSDVREGAVVLTKGTRISDLGGEIGTLAFLGHDQVKIVRKPRVAILSTGNELYDISKGSDVSRDAWGFRVFDANRPGLRAALESLDISVVDQGIVDDDADRTLAALERGIEDADIVITTGGTSMGESDLLKPLIERRVKNGKIHFGRVAMKPGKPTTFATASSSKGEQRYIFALPGNPASALVCFYVFVLPAIRKLAGYPERLCNLARVRVRLMDEMRCDPRPEFHRAVVSVDENGQLCAKSTGSQRSSGMHSMATANALVCVPSLQNDGPKVLTAGSFAEAILLGSVS